MSISALGRTMAGVSEGKSGAPHPGLGCSFVCEIHGVLERGVHRAVMSCLGAGR